MKVQSQKYKDRFKDAVPKLSAAQMEAIKRFSKCKSYPDGTVLLKAGEPNFKFHVIQKGEIEVVDTSGSKPEVVLTHEANEFTGDLANLSGRNSNMDAIAKGQVEVFEITVRELRQIIKEQTDLSDTILAAFIARSNALKETNHTGLQVVGKRQMQDAFRIRDFLTKNRILYTWIDVDNHPETEKLLSNFGIAMEDLPVVVSGDKWLLRNPPNIQLAEVTGVRKAIGDTLFDLAVVGAGPGGLAASVYGGSEGLSTITLERFAPGGQAGSSSKIENYLGFPTGISGAELGAKATLQAEKFGVEMSISSEAKQLTFDGSDNVIELKSGEKIHAKSVVIASGANYRKLPIPNLEEFEKRGVYYSATAMEATLCSGEEIAVVGGGNSAGQAAVFLSATVRKLYLIVRGDGLSHSMSNYLIRRIEETPNIQLMIHTEVIALEGEKLLESITVENNQTKSKQELPVTSVFSFIGAVPNSDWLPDSIEKDKNGFIKTGLDVADSPNWKLARQPFMLETIRPGVFAVGDVRSSSSKRVSAAVGEGAMAVQFIHAYLKSVE